MKTAELVKTKHLDEYFTDEEKQSLPSTVAEAVARKKERIKSWDGIPYGIYADTYDIETEDVAWFPPSPSICKCWQMLSDGTCFLMGIQIDEQLDEFTAVSRFVWEPNLC